MTAQRARPDEAVAPVARFVVLTTRPEGRDELLGLLEANRRHTEAEPGTRTWTLHSVRDRTDSLAMYEVYDDEAAAGVHDAQNPALASILERQAELLSEPPLILTLDVTPTPLNR